MTVSVSPFNEWRYRYDGGTHWVSGMSLYTLLRDGWKQIC